MDQMPVDLKFQLHTDRVVVGRFAEALDLARVTDRLCETATDDLRGTDSLEKRLGHVNEVNSFSGKCSWLEIIWIQPFYYVNVRGVVPYVVVHEEIIVILCHLVNVVVHT